MNISLGDAFHWRPLPAPAPYAPAGERSEVRSALERGARQRYEWTVVRKASRNFVVFSVRVIRAIERIAHGERDLSLGVERMGVAAHDFEISYVAAREIAAIMATRSVSQAPSCRFCRSCRGAELDPTQSANAGERRNDCSQSADKTATARSI